MDLLIRIFCNRHIHGHMKLLRECAVFSFGNCRVEFLNFYLNVRLDMFTGVESPQLVLFFCIELEHALHIRTQSAM
jgi:hypothetical protein